MPLYSMPPINLVKPLPVVPTINVREPACIQVPEGFTARPPRPQLRLARQIPVDQLDLLWESWQSTPEGSRFATPISAVAIEPSLQSAPIAQFDENRPPSPNPSLRPSPATPRSGKRWGIFGNKTKSQVNTPKDTDSARHQLIKKPSQKLFKKNSKGKHKSTPDFKVTPAQSREDLSKISAICEPVPVILPPLPVFPIQGLNEVTVSATEVQDDLPDAIYFIVDPEWDASQGDAMCYFISPPE